MLGHVHTQRSPSSFNLRRMVSFPGLSLRPGSLLHVLSLGLYSSLFSLTSPLSLFCAVFVTIKTCLGSQAPLSISKIWKETAEGAGGKWQMVGRDPQTGNSGHPTVTTRSLFYTRKCVRARVCTCRHMCVCMLVCVCVHAHGQNDRGHRALWGFQVQYL